MEAHTIVSRRMLLSLLREWIDPPEECKDQNEAVNLELLLVPRLIVDEIVRIVPALSVEQAIFQ